MAVKWGEGEGVKGVCVLGDGKDGRGKGTSIFFDLPGWLHHPEIKVPYEKEHKQNVKC